MFSKSSWTFDIVAEGLGDVFIAAKTTTAREMFGTGVKTNVFLNKFKK